MVKRKKIGIALGGGGPRGIAHIGVLKALDEAGIKPDLISGTSVGSLVGALYAFGIPLEEQKNMALNMRWWKISKLQIPRFGLVSNKNLRFMIEHILGRNKKIEKANIPLAIMTCNIETGEKIVFQKGDLSEAIMASSAIPGIFSPVEINKKMLVDGALVENVPVSPLKQMGADIVIAIDLMKKPLPRKPRGITEVISNSIYIMLEQTKEVNKIVADIVLEPNLPTYIKTDNVSLEKMYNEGYEIGKKNINKINKLLNN